MVYDLTGYNAHKSSSSEVEQCDYALAPEQIPSFGSGRVALKICAAEGGVSVPVAARACGDDDG